MPYPQPVHPRGPRARVLLSSVFGPYARDDAFGSRQINHFTSDMDTLFVTYIAEVLGRVIQRLAA